MTDNAAGERKCGSCGHESRHSPRWGCMAEIGDSGSGSVADAVFCKCAATPDASSASLRTADGGLEEQITHDDASEPEGGHSSAGTGHDHMTNAEIQERYAREREWVNPYDNPVDDDGGRVPLFDPPLPAASTGASEPLSEDVEALAEVQAMSAPDPKAAYRPCAECDHGVYQYRHWCQMSSATSDADDAETLAAIVYQTDTLDMGGYTTRDAQRVSRAILASDWLRDLLDAARREGGAEALREAADALLQIDPVADWLRDRAARIARRS